MTGHLGPLVMRNIEPIMPLAVGCIGGMATALYPMFADVHEIRKIVGTASTAYRDFCTNHPQMHEYEDITRRIARGEDSLDDAARFAVMREDPVIIEGRTLNPAHALDGKDFFSPDTIATYGAFGFGAGMFLGLVVGRRSPPFPCYD